ncbi:MAG: hypothetical protein K2X46_01230 [Roseomonas sp.]|nr:hypothetical protein [Roseomonas sp.]
MLPQVDFDHIATPLGYPVGFFSDYPRSLIEKINASALSEFLGLASVDCTRKHYAKPPEITEDDGLGAQITAFVLGEGARLSAEFRQVGELHCDGAGHFMAGINLIRLFGSLFAPLSLANRGFYLESASVIRMYLEQLAWCAKIRWNFRETDEMLEITGEKSIHTLKKIYPGAGDFYGILS